MYERQIADASVQMKKKTQLHQAWKNYKKIMEILAFNLGNEG